MIFRDAHNWKENSMTKNKVTRRDFIGKTGAGLVGMAVSSNVFDLAEMSDFSVFRKAYKSKMKFGMVTYQWGNAWDLPTLITNLEKTGFVAVELRTLNAHGVEPSLNASQRVDVKKRFSDSSITCVGYGSNFEFHNPDQVQLRKNIEGIKPYIILCKDIGATGIKVKPNGLLPGVPKEKTIAQIAASLNEVGKFAQDYGQKVRVEVHGRETSKIVNMKSIFEQVTEPNVKICWNSEPADIDPPGLDANFNSVKKWIGDTAHLRPLNAGDYPYQQLFNLFAGINFNGWLLLEASSTPADKAAAMKEQVATYNQLMANVKKV